MKALNGFSIGFDGSVASGALGSTYVKAHYLGDFYRVLYSVAEFMVKYKHMLKRQCISVTKLRTKTKECLDGLKADPKFIFVNNEPVAVLLNIEEYEEYFQRPILRELDKDEVSAALKKKAITAKKTHKKDLISI